MAWKAPQWLARSKAAESEQAATETPDADLAVFAKKTLPTLTDHKHMAGELPGCAFRQSPEVKRRLSSLERGARHEA
jgi:hypothetical protein